MATKKTTTKKATVSQVKSINFHFEQGAEKTVHATIKATKIKSFKTFKIAWKYTTANGKSYALDKAFNSSASTHSQTVPDNAVSISITVTPIDTVSKKAKSRKPVTKKFTVSKVTMTPPQTPSVNILKVEGKVVTVSLSIPSYKDESSSAVSIEFSARRTLFGTNDSAYVSVAKQVEITKESVYTTWTGMEIGYDYEFRARAITGKFDKKSNSYKSLQYSEWSDWSNTTAGQYPAPKENCTVTKYRDGRGIAIGISLPEANRNLISKIELIRDDQNPDEPFNWNTIDQLPLDYFISISDETNPKYFNDLGPYRYRIRAMIVGDTEGRGTQSDWRNYPQYIDAAEKHEAPTTWTNNSKCEVDKSIELYWMANTTDGSREWSANLLIEYSENGEEFEEYKNEIIPNTIPVLDDVSAHFYIFDIKEAGVYRWQVRTTNVQDPDEDTWGEWSTAKELKAYGRPEVSVGIDGDTEVEDDQVSYHFPMNVHATVRNTNGQRMMYYTVKIVNLNRYEEDYYYSTKVIPSNSMLYSKVVDVSAENNETGDYYYELLPSYVRLVNDQEYKVIFDTVFDSGLNISDEYTFKYDAGDSDDTVNISLISNEYDPESATIILKPEILINGEPSPDFDISIYRVAYDGEAVLINQNPYDSGSGETILDPHPTLNDVTYRILAINRITGKYFYQEEYVDIPDESSLVINWDESWVVDDGDETTKELRITENSYGGNILKLRYNIERSYQNNKDVVLVEYIGRRNPVSYYGTQQGYSMTWNTDVPYNDDKTIELLDQLMAYDGDCYVRESTGKGFWANLKISYSHKSGELQYAVTINVTKVEGGA